MNTDLEIMRDAMTYLVLYNSPPPTGTDAAADWWMSAAKDLGAVAAKWENHPLVISLLMAIYEYLESKTKAVAP